MLLRIQVFWDVTLCARWEGPDILQDCSTFTFMFKYSKIWILGGTHREPWCHIPQDYWCVVLQAIYGEAVGLRDSTRGILLRQEVSAVSMTRTREKQLEDLR